MAGRRGPNAPPPYQISPPSAQRQGCRTQILNFLVRFDQNVEYKLPARAYPLRDFHKICRVLFIPFQDTLAVKILLDLLEALWSYGGFQLRVSGFPKCSVPTSGETMRQTPKCFRDARTCSRMSPAAGVVKNVEFFVCLFVCPSRF